MTTPDPPPDAAPIPDDATTAFDAEAARSTALPAPPAPAEAAAPASTVDPWPAPPVATVPPTAAPGGAYRAPGSPGSPAWGGSAPSAGPAPSTGSLPAWGSARASSAPTPGSPVHPGQATRSGTPPAMAAGVLLVVVGAVLLLNRFVELSFNGVAWPLWIVVPGVAMLVASFFIPPRGGVGLAIPGAIVTIVGLILWVQAAYDLYATWAYAWALVAPTGPGLGMLLYGLVHRDGELIGDGFRTMVVGLGLFLVFALFFEGVIGLSGDPIPNLDEVLPYAIIGLGGAAAGRAELRGGRPAPFGGAPPPLIRRSPGVTSRGPWGVRGATTAAAQGQLISRIS